MRFQRIGLKVSNASEILKNRCLVETLIRHFDYLEFVSPNLQFKALQDIQKEFDIRLISHGNYMSLAHENPCSNSILSVAKKELRQGKSPYFAEHIGVLNRHVNGPSLGYLLPPSLTEITSQVVSMNANELCKFLETEVLLENPVVYVTEKNNLSYTDFLESLDKKLLPGVCWLIDFAHLLVTCKNIGVNPKTVLRQYAHTSRSVREIHFSGIYRDTNGVYHDSHTPDAGQFLKSVGSLINLYDQSGLQVTNATLETRIANERDLEVAIAAANILRGNIGQFEDLSDLRETTSDETRQDAERKGRSRILKKRIMLQAGPGLAKNFDNALSNSGYGSLDNYCDLITSGKHLLKKCYVGTFGEEPDTFDLLTPVAADILSSRVQSESSNEFARAIMLKSHANALRCSEAQDRAFEMNFSGKVAGFTATKIYIEKTSDSVIKARSEPGCNSAKHQIVEEASWFR